MIEATIHRFDLRNFYKYRIQERGLWYLLDLTSTYYPRFFSMGYYDPKEHKIIIALVGNWELRLEHEKGHSIGLKHTPIFKIGYIMHPWGFLRGKK